MSNVIVSTGGTSGPRGNSMLSGSGVPASTVGIDGDYYANTAGYPNSLVLYGPKAAGAWPSAGITLATSAGFVDLSTAQTIAGNKTFTYYTTLQTGQVNGAFNLLGTVGFFGATAAGRQTVAGAKGGNAALASLITALAALGLITDNTT